MKVTQLETIGLHAEAIGRGWTEASGTELALVYPPIERVNGSGAALVEGDVVVIDTDGEIITTTTAQDTRPKGVVLDDIAIGESGPVAFAGPVDLINVTASVTAGHWAQTSTTAGQAASNGSTTPSAGSFAYFTSSGTSPSAFLPPGGGTSGSASDSLGLVSVIDYGAVGDGTTDDTTAIAAAITAAAEYDTIYFPTTSSTSPTVYKITSTLSVGKALRFLGPSAYPNPDTSPDGRVVIRMATNNTTAISQSAIKRLGIENLVIDNAGTAASGKGVLALGSVAMRHALIRDFYDNLFIDGQTGGSYVTTIDESFFHNATRANIYLDDKVNNFRMHGGYISTGAYGILASGGIFGMSVDGTAIESYTTAGIYIDGLGPTSGQVTSVVRLAGLYMDVVSGTAYDIRIGDTNSVSVVTIEDCWIEPGTAAQVHVSINKANKVTIANTYINDNSNTSLDAHATNCTNLIIEGSVFEGTVNTPASTLFVGPGFTATPSSVGAANAIGTSKYLALADHVHQGASSAGDTPMLADDAASPFTFDDLLQNDEGTEWLFPDA